MLTVLGSPRRTAHGLTRRQSLQIGGLSALGAFGLPSVLEASEGRRTRRPGKAKSVILLYLLGGAATQDMIDLKPSGPVDIRGEFTPISTSVPGVQICEHMPKTSRWMHKMALVRSLNHKAGCHNTLPSYTGLELLTPDNTITRDTFPPSMGSVCEFLRSGGGRTASATELPDYVYMPCYLGWGQGIRRAGPYGGFIGKRFDALTTEVDPYAPPGATPTPGNPATVLGSPRLPDSTLAEGLTVDRLNERRTLMQQVEDHLRAGDPSLDNYTRTQRRAFHLLTSNDVGSAFDLEREDPRLRDRYGRTLFGNCSMIARRLVERGVRFINVTWDLFWDRVKVNYDCWDTHTRNFQTLKNRNLPEFDQVYSALLEDLEARGLLDETLVVVMSEMGRTPTINKNAGRDHWTYCYGMWFAGGGIKGGTVVGESDGQAAYVKDRPVSPADVCCTIYEALGIDIDTTVPERNGRPVHIHHDGRPIREIL